MLPTFIVAGAAKSGTTAIWENLKKHPQICMSWMKESNFFITSLPSARYDKGLDWYQSLFCAPDAESDPGTSALETQSLLAIGEVSPSYMVCKESPQLIYQTLPNIQLLFILRDPVERIYSQYRYALHRGIRLPPFNQLFDDWHPTQGHNNFQAIEGRHPFLEKALYDSSYHLHLDRFLEFFPKERVMVFLYEDWCNDTQSFMQTIYRTIGVDNDFVPPDISERYNVTQQARFPRLQRALGLAGQKIMVMNLSPRLFFVLRSVRTKLWQLNSRKTQPVSISPEARQWLIGMMEETIAYVEAYLSHPLTSWRQT